MGFAFVISSQVGMDATVDSDVAFKQNWQLSLVAFYFLQLNFVLILDGTH